MNIPLGSVLTLRRGDDIVLCENCGRYLYLPETTEAIPAAKSKASRAQSAQPASA
jgi:hypothetical protein